MRGRGRITIRSPWTPALSLVLLVFALVGFSVLSQDPGEVGGPVVVAAYLAPGTVSLAFAVRGLFRRTVIVGRTVTLIGWWRTRHIEVRQAEPVVIDDRFELLYVWAPEVVTAGDDVMVLNDHAGFSRSEHRPNRRVARVCTRLTDHTSGGPSPA